MKKRIALFLVIALCLVGCGDAPSLVSHTHEDLTISIPEDFLDLSDADFAADMDFAYGLDPIGIIGLREEKAVFAAYGLELDLQQYGALVIKGNNVDCTLTEKDGIPTFTYEANGYTYVVTIWQTEEAFWTVQAYCPAERFADSQSQMWEILQSIAV